MKKEEAKFEELKNKFPQLDKFAEKQDMQKNLIALLTPEFFEKYKLPDDSYFKDFNDPNALIEKISDLSTSIYLGSLIHPVVLKERYEKLPDKTDVRITQIENFMDSNEIKEKIKSIKLPKSKIINKKVWTKDGKKGISIRKIIILKTLIVYLEKL